MACPALQVSHDASAAHIIFMFDWLTHTSRSPFFKIAPVVSALKEVALQQKHKKELEELRQECRQEEQEEREHEEREREAVRAAAAAQTGPFEPLLAPLLQKIYALL